jgi:DNA mismatch repair protein MSH2
MRTLWNVLTAAFLLFGLGVLVTGCGSTAGEGKMEGKMEGGKMEGGKMEGGKMEGGKMEGGKMEGGKMDNGKMQEKGGGGKGGGGAPAGPLELLERDRDGFLQEVEDRRR